MQDDAVGPSTGAVMCSNGEGINLGEAFMHPLCCVLTPDDRAAWQKPSSVFSKGKSHA